MLGLGGAEEEEAVREAPSDAQAWLRLGAVLNKFGEFSEAETLLVASIKRLPAAPASQLTHQGESEHDLSAEERCAMHTLLVEVLLKRKKLLEPAIRRQLAPFYESEAARAILAD